MAPLESHNEKLSTFIEMIRPPWVRPDISAITP